MTGATKYEASFIWRDEGCLMACFSKHKNRKCDKPVIPSDMASQFHTIYTQDWGGQTGPKKRVKCVGGVSQAGYAGGMENVSTCEDLRGK
jgi:hypothetical protein